MHSLSKRSNLAGYRCAFVAGDPAVVGELLAVRKNLGLMMPGPAAARDDRRPRRRRPCRGAARPLRGPSYDAAGRRSSRPVSGSTTPRRRSTSGPPGTSRCWDTVAWLADRGILVAPGSFYGRAGERHVRVAFTATDERVAAALPPRLTRGFPGLTHLAGMLPARLQLPAPPGLSRTTSSLHAPCPTRARLTHRDAHLGVARAAAGAPAVLGVPADVPLLAGDRRSAPGAGVRRGRARTAPPTSPAGVRQGCRRR